MAYVTNRLQEDERWQRLLLGDWALNSTKLRSNWYGPGVVTHDLHLVSVGAEL